MGMPLELNTLIVTKNRETRLKDNYFLLTKEGYRLYPLDIPLEVRKTLDTEISGHAIIKKIEMENNLTTITYKLISLHSTN